MDHLWALARDASDVPGTPSEEACAGILSRWSWPAMFDELARAVEGEVDEDAGRMLALMAVSYTHLTLPTIYSV